MSHLSLHHLAVAVPRGAARTPSAWPRPLTHAASAVPSAAMYATELLSSSVGWSGRRPTRREFLDAEALVATKANPQSCGS